MNIIVTTYRETSLFGFSHTSIDFCISFTPHCDLYSATVEINYSIISILTTSVQFVLHHCYILTFPFEWIRRLMFDLQNFVDDQLCNTYDSSYYNYSNQVHTSTLLYSKFYFIHICLCMAFVYYGTSVRCSLTKS